MSLTGPRCHWSRRGNFSAQSKVKLTVPGRDRPHREAEADQGRAIAGELPELSQKFFNDFSGMSKIWKNAKYLISLTHPVQTAQTGQLRRPKLPSPHRDEFLDVLYVELLGGFLDRRVDV